MAGTNISNRVKQKVLLPVVMQKVLVRVELAVQLVLIASIVNIVLKMEERAACANSDS